MILTAIELEKLRFLVVEYRALIGQRIRDKQEQLKRGDSKHPEMVQAMMRSEVMEFAELRALSEKLGGGE